MKLTHLTLIDALGRTGNMHLTAEQMDFSKPAISNTLKKLERLLGFAVFERLPRISLDGQFAPETWWRMDYRLETEIWVQAQVDSAPEAFEKLLIKAVLSYKRSPGLHSFERIHASAIGIQGLVALRSALIRTGWMTQGEQASTYVSIRAPMRIHLYQHLQMGLMRSGSASEPVAEDQLMRDLNL